MTDAQKVWLDLLEKWAKADDELPAPAAPLNKGNARQRPGILGSPDAPGKVTVCGRLAPVSRC